MINENIRNARKKKGISQEELAIELNVVRQTVSKWEKGLSVPDADILIQIADLLEVSVNDLLDIKPQNDDVENIAAELAHLNEQLAHKNREKALYLQAEKKRGLILLLSFMAMLITINIKNEILSIALTGGCMLAALIILYRNLSLLTKITTENMKIGTLKVTTLFNMAVLIFAVMIAIFNEASFIRLSESGEQGLALAVTCIIMLFGGYISPKLPFTRHTGLRLPWTVQDEETWNIAHKVIGFISLPLVLLYLAASCTINNFEAITLAVIFLWIGIPGLISFVFWWKKLYGKH
ncbi:helix-turn-helix domain-containing protein [Frisingicoccus sp.]|uniref:helix-turn-helix domain-containing protein n=1 Tax=Frisingicoccus sp. TaxID=1918627 RepID=UPI003AB53CAD